MLYKKFRVLFDNKATYLKYLFSYLVIVTVLIISFFFITKNRFENRFYEKYLQQSDIKVELISKYIGDELRGISSVTASVKSNSTFNHMLYKTKGGCRLQIYNEMTKYSTAMRMVRTMVYYSKGIDEVITTREVVTYEDGIFYIMDGTNSFAFDPKPYYDKYYGQLVFVYDEKHEYLIYFPSISEKAGDIFFYILKPDEILELMKDVISEELIAIALLNNEGKVVVGKNIPQLEKAIEYVVSEKEEKNESTVLGNGIYKVDNLDSINVHSNIDDGFSIVALVSGDYLKTQIGIILAGAYPALMLVGLIGLILVQFVMRITYVPLRKLTRKIASESRISKDYLTLLDEKFDKQMQQNEYLKNKVEEYRLSIQKAMLETILSTHQGLDRAGEVCEVNIDRFFSADFNERIYVVKIASPGKKFPCEDILYYMREMLPGEESCSLLERQKDSAIYLINYSGMEMDKDNIIENMMIQICDDYGFFTAVSGSSESPLDIPVLYNNAITASKYWTQQNFVDYRKIPQEEPEVSYPHRKLKRFSSLLAQNQFLDAEKEMDELLKIIWNDYGSISALSDFYGRSILLDILFAIADQLKTNKVDLPVEYNESIYFCRNFLYNEKKDIIVSNIYKMLAKLKNSIIGFDVEMLDQVINESYTDPNFSITVIADRFHVSIAYMSYLVKKNLDKNFSDYLWELRVNKAKELLLTTDIPVDQISTEVGYLNPDSFRRKFKTETGMTPIQYRKTCK